MQQLPKMSRMATMRSLYSIAEADPELAAAAARDYYKAHSEEVNERIRQYRKRLPHKRKAQNLVKYALEKGVLIRAEVCSGDIHSKIVACTHTKPEAHHDDYSLPLSVKWLCRRHHRQRHEVLRRLGIDPD